MLTALDGGAGVARAAASVGLAEQTVRSWIRRGRENPEGRFAPFAIAADRMRRVRVVTVDPNASPRPLASRTSASMPGE